MFAEKPTVSRPILPDRSWLSDASRIDTRSLRREYMLPARLLGVGLPLTVAFRTGMLMVLIDGVGVWEAALIAAILAPTDAALGQEVVSDPAVPARIRQGLNVESGLNDGLVVPAVALFLVLASNEEEAGSVGFWVRFVVEQVGVAMVVGVLVGGVGAYLLTMGEKANWVDGVYAQLATFALAIAALTTSLQFKWQWLHRSIHGRHGVWSHGTEVGRTG